MNTDLMFSSATGAHDTPKWLVDEIAGFMGGIDLDPCASETDPAKTGAAQWFTKAENGLERPHTGRVYMNLWDGGTGAICAIPEGKPSVVSNAGEFTLQPLNSFALDRIAPAYSMADAGNANGTGTETGSGRWNENGEPKRAAKRNKRGRTQPVPDAAERSPSQSNIFSAPPANYPGSIHGAKNVNGKSPETDRLNGEPTPPNAGGYWPKRNDTTDPKRGARQSGTNPGSETMSDCPASGQNPLNGPPPIGNDAWTHGADVAPIADLPDPLPKIISSLWRTIPAPERFPLTWSPLALVVTTLNGIATRTNGATIRIGWQKYDPTLPPYLVIEYPATVYCNPPYGREIGLWTRKMALEYNLGNVTEGILLVPARTDTKWWGTVAHCPVCFMRGRLRFGDAAHSAPFPSALIYLGDRVPAFMEWAGQFWIVYAPREMLAFE